MARTVESNSAGTDGRDAVSQPPPRPGLRAATVPPPYRNALVVIAITVTMASIFAVSYTVALARPTPHDIPAGVIGVPAHRPGVLAALEGATQNGLRVTRYASLARALPAPRARRAGVQGPPSTPGRRAGSPTTPAGMLCGVGRASATV